MQKKELLLKLVTEYFHYKSFSKMLSEMYLDTEADLMMDKCEIFETIINFIQNSYPTWNSLYAWLKVQSKRKLKIHQIEIIKFVIEHMEWITKKGTK